MKSFIFSFLVLVTFSCTNKSKKSKDVVQSIPPEVEESSIELPVKYEEIEINGKDKIQNFKFNAYNKDKVLAIKKLIESGQKLEYYKRELIDVTGEGNLDTVEIRIDNTGKNSFLITNSIFSHGDTLDFSYDADLFDMYFQNWENDSTFYKLLPYSIYNEVLSFRDFILKDNIFEDPDFYDPENLKYYEPKIKSQLENMNLLEKYKGYEGHYIDLINKKSLPITYLHYNDGDIEVWFEPAQEFIQIFAP
ncbi:hypothetical protein EON78_05030 [bacterium]|nr:MAG: hypothetical protein EON78_05030 [bacterium]